MWNKGLDRYDYDKARAGLPQVLPILRVRVTFLSRLGLTHPCDLLCSV